MKKIVLILAFIIILSSCTERRPQHATDLLFDALAALESVPAYDVYYSEAPKYSESFMSPETASLLYGDADMTSYAESFACVLGRDDSVWEIHIFVSLSAGDAGFIENALEKRLHILQNKEIYVYDSEAYEKRVASAKILRDGKVVCLAVCDDNASVLKEIKK